MQYPQRGMYEVLTEYLVLQWIVQRLLLQRLHVAQVGDWQGYGHSI